MNRIKLFTMLGALALVAVCAPNRSFKGVHAYANNYEVDVSEFSVQKGSAASFSVDEENKTITHEGGWDGAFAITNQFDTTATQYSLAADFKASETKYGDLGAGFVLYYDSANYMMFFVKWSDSGIGTIDGLHMLGKINGVDNEVYESARSNWNDDFILRTTFTDSWSDFNGWSTDSPTPTGDGDTGNWNHFRSESKVLLGTGFRMGMTVERMQYKGRDVDNVQLFFKDAGKDDAIHTWYTPSFAVDIFTNPKGGEASTFKASAPAIGFLNFSTGAITYSNLEFTSNKAPVSATEVTLRSLKGVPEIRNVDEENQTLQYKGTFLNNFIHLDGVDTSTANWSFVSNVQNTAHNDGGDDIIGFALYYDANNYMYIYLRYSNIGTIDGLHSLVFINGSDGGAQYQVARNPYDVLGMWDNRGYLDQSGFYDAWSDFSGWITDATMPGTFNEFRSNSAVLLSTGYELGISYSRINLMDRDVDQIQLSVTGVGKNDSAKHTWYTPAICYDAFTNPKGGSASEFKNVAPKLCLINNNVGAVTYSNCKFNNKSINIKAPNYYEVSFGDYGETQSVEEGLTATAPSNPTREGYEFNGWKNSGETYDFSTPVTGNVSLEADWLKYHAVTFDSDGGTPIDSQSVLDGEVATKPANPTKEGYTFKQWNLGNEEYNFLTPVHGDLELKAIYDEIPAVIYTVTFDGVEGINPINVEEGNTITAPANPTKEGYNFKGWYLGNELFDFDTPITENITLTAHWAQLFTVSFDNGVSAQTVEEGNLATRPEDPTKLWSTFEGWKLPDGQLFDFNTPITSDISLTASFVENELLVDGVYYNKFINAKGMPAVLKAGSDNKSMDFSGGWNGNFAVTDQFNTHSNNWELSADIVGKNGGDGNDIIAGFVVYYGDNNYSIMYFRWSNIGTIDGLHMLSVVNGSESGYQVAKDQWSENFSDKSGFVDFWSDFSGWTTDARNPVDGNFNNFRNESESTLQYTLGIKLFRERTTYKERLVDRYQLAVTDEGKDGRIHTWYTPSFVTDAFTNPQGGADSAVKNEAPKVGFTCNNIESINISKINFKDVAQEQAAALEQAKTSAKAELESYKNASDYREAEQAQLATIVTNGKTAIDAATDEAGVAAALATAKAQADALKTKAQYEAEESQGQSSSEPVQPDSSEPSGQEQPAKKGCGGSIVATSALVSALALAGLGLLIFNKRKQE